MTSVMTGSQTPRFGHWPECTSTKGDNVIELARRFGFKLHDWQKFVLRYSLGEVPDEMNPGKKMWAAPQVGLVVPRRNGKTFILYMRILAGLFLFDEKIIYTSQDVPALEEAFNWLEDLLLDTTNPQSVLLRKKIKKIWKRSGKWEIILHSGACFKIKNRAKKPGRGLAIDLLIIDEAYCYTEENQAALEPALSTRPNPQIWYVSTPPLDAVTGQPFTRVRELGFNRTEGMAWFEWSTDASKPIDITDRKLWRQANPALGFLIRESTLASDVKKWPEDKFKRERLAVWPIEAGNNLVSAEAWNSVADPESQPAEDTEEKRTLFSIGVCAWQVKSKAHAAVTVWSEREDGLGHLEVIRTDPGVDWVPEYLAEMKEKYGEKLVAIGIDPQSPLKAAAFKFASLGLTIPENPEEPEFGDLAVMTGADWVAANSQFVSAVEDKSFRHRQFDPLDQAVTGAATRKTTSGIWVFDRARSEVDISPLTAGLIARWAYVTRKDSVGSGDYDLSDSFC